MPSSTPTRRCSGGTVRSDYGSDLMRNGAHASDSPENALRERRIIGLLDAEKDTCDVQQVIREYMAQKA